jgi:hypothetical protein
VQSEEFASRYPCHSELPDGRILSHDNTLNLFDGQADRCCDYGTVENSHLHDGNRGGNPIRHLDVALHGVLPWSTPPISSPFLRRSGPVPHAQAPHESSSFSTHG